jgi:hypothetical protein
MFNCVREDVTPSGSLAWPIRTTVGTNLERDKKIAVSDPDASHLLGVRIIGGVIGKRKLVHGI